MIKRIHNIILESSKLNSVFLIHLILLTRIYSKTLKN